MTMPDFGKFNTKAELICQVLFLNHFPLGNTLIGTVTKISYSRVKTILKNYSEDKEYIKIVDIMISEYKKKPKPY